jgi:exonuclease VII small subunit
MAALERLRRELESGDLDPMEALVRCREAEEHYRVLDGLLTQVEREIEEMQNPET